MKIKRIVSIILTLALLSSFQVSLGAAGGKDDPLISKSYAEGEYKKDIAANIAASVTLSFKIIEKKLNTILAEGGLIAGGFNWDNLPEGERVNMKLGGSIVLHTGSAQLEITRGEVINVTTGKPVSDGTYLLARNRYMAVEDTAASVIMLSDCTVALDGYALPGEKPASFSDVSKDHWAFDYVERMAELGLVNGTGGGEFSPSQNMSRGDFVTLIGRLHGVDPSQYQGTDFSDVKAGTYYAPYVQWASQNGLVDGYGGGKFGPLDSIDRSQMAALVVRYADFAGIEVGRGITDNSFADDAKIPSWARNAVYRAHGVGLITGKTGNLFDPAGNASRAEVCTIVCRLIDLR